MQMIFLIQRYACARARSMLSISSVQIVEMAQVSSGTLILRVFTIGRDRDRHPTNCYRPFLQGSKFRESVLDERDHERIRELNFTSSNRGCIATEAEPHIVQHRPGTGTLSSSSCTLRLLKHACMRIPETPSGTCPRPSAAADRRMPWNRLMQELADFN